MGVAAADVTRVGVEAADSDSRLEFRLTSRIPTLAFLVGVASYSSQAGSDVVDANGVVRSDVVDANGVVGRDVTEGGSEDDGIEDGESGESGKRLRNSIITYVLNTGADRRVNLKLAYDYSAEMKRREMSIY